MTRGNAVVAESVMLRFVGRTLAGSLRARPSILLRPTNFRFQNAYSTALMSNPESHANFDLVKRLSLEHAHVTVSKWRSRITGLTVVHLDYDAPLVNGYFVVATEIFDDSGCPHTLEHLVFMGSEKYPHKGVLDLLANRGFSNGTNAWTDADHTAYTISTAGEQGFLQLLPIYLDHILYPTITDAGFVTEVHHINEQGHNSGVVYSEMQGRENTSGDLMALRQSQLLDRPGSAYRSETGGLMEALRKLTPEQIRKYHSTYYTPHNLSLIVTGKLSSGTTSLLDVLQEHVEPSIIRHGQNKGPRPPGWKRPFLETPSANRVPVSEPVKDIVEFPEKDESVGELSISYLGPAPNEYLERKALDVLGTYLTSSGTAPLTKEYVETESPLCTWIYFAEEVRATRVTLPVYFSSVPTEHLDNFEGRFKKSLKRIIDNGIDMSRMKMVIDRDERQLRSKLESSKGNTYSGTIISDFLYGPQDGSELKVAMDDINQYKELHKWDAKRWADLLQKYYIDLPAVVVIGKPSASMAQRLEKEEKERLAKQVETLGPEGLKKAAAILEKAKKENDKPAPKEIIESFPVPDVASISWIPVQTVQEPGTGRKVPTNITQSPELLKFIEADGNSPAFFLEYDHVKSDFVEIQAIFSLATVPVHLQPYLWTYLATFFSLPVVRSNGQKLTYEEVVDQLDNDTVSYDASFGFNNLLTETIRVVIKVDVDSYEKAVAWLKDSVYGAEFDRERLHVTIAKLQQTLPETKRDGSNVLHSLWSTMMLAENSSTLNASILPQVDFLPTLAQDIQEQPKKVVAAFEEIRKHVTDPSGVRFCVTGNVSQLKAPRSTWTKYFSDVLPVSPLAPVPLIRDTLSPFGQNPVKKAMVMKLPTIESSYVMHTTKSISGFGHPEFPVIRLASEVLNATESYLWRYIRGSGLAYGAYVSLDVESGFLTFSLYRSSNVLGAFDAAAKVVKGLVNGTVELDQATIDSAVSTLVYSTAKSVSTPTRAAESYFINQGLKGIPKDYGIQLLKEFQKVTKQDILDAFKQYYLPLFEPTTSSACIVTAPSKADEIAQGLKTIGFEVELRELAVKPEELDEFSDSEEDSNSESDDGGR